MSMTLEQAIRMLHPETSEEALNEILRANASINDGLSIFNEKTAEAVILACEVMQREVEREKGCEYCDFSSGDVGATMNNCGDSFLLIKSRKGAAIATDEKHYYILDVNFCPNCGNDLNKGKVDGDE